MVAAKGVTESCPRPRNQRPSSRRGQSASPAVAGRGQGAWSAPGAPSAPTRGERSLGDNARLCLQCQQRGAEKALFGEFLDW